MVKTGVDATWNSTVSQATSAVKSIGKLKNPELSSTTLTPFTDFASAINELNNSLSVYKDFHEADAIKMRQAGTNKSDDDIAGASSMKAIRA
ncbi:MAG: hypothetical protein H9W82_16375 [Lactobacillus sp.]|nr:hypothetical protein [Lactobacillus sp.]